MASTKIKSLSLNGVTWIQSGYGTPNHISVKGTLYIDLETAIEYINKDGLALWGEFYDSTYIDTILTGISGNNAYITGGTYSSGTTIMINNSGGTFNITGYTYIPHLQYNNLNSTVWNYGSGNISDNISFGRNALVSIINGNNNSAIGSNALSGTTTGHYNTAIGGNALKNNNTGVQNFGIGSYALYYNTTGNYNTAIGTSALQNNTDAERNVAIGGFSLYRNIGYRNIAIGFFAGSATKGSDNILLGANAVNTTDGVVSGSNNTIIGTLLSGVINGSNNTIFGKPSGLASTTTNNIIIADGSGNIRFKDDNVNTILPRLAGTGDRMVVTSPSGELSARTIVDTLFTGGTVVGQTNFTTSLSANTMSATTYLNLPITLSSTTNTLINADVTGKAIITKEYVNNRLVLEKSADYTLSDSDSGGIIIFTASAILTIPTGLAAGFECTFVTLTGVTLTVTSTGNTLNNAAGSTLSANLSFTLKRMIATDTFIATGNL